MNQIFRLMRCNDWDILLSGILGDESGTFSEANVKLNKQSLSAKDTAIKYRILNHWAGLGLIEDNREGETSRWRKLSPLDVLLINVLVELRQFGLPLDACKKCSESIYLNQSKTQKISYLEIGVYLCLNQTQTSLIIFSDGHCELLREIDLALSQEIGLLEDTHLVINLNKICQQTINTSLPKFSNPRHFLTEEQ